jgi:hypothetical protein
VLLCLWCPVPQFFLVLLPVLVPLLLTFCMANGSVDSLAIRLPFVLGGPLAQWWVEHTGPEHICAAPLAYVHRRWSWRWIASSVS